MASRKVIVFGPTGAVGSAAARTASDLGAHVVLAMRDTSKSIPSLDPGTEKQGSFERVTADLTKPDTVREAVTSTGAKHAFIYLAVHSPDGMKATIEALKSAGIELVVFLSSFTVTGDPRDIQPADMIPYLHAKVEISLEEVYGSDKYVAVRPGSFASNNMQYKAGIEKGEVKIFMPEATIDNIVPEDIGRVSGIILAKGPQNGEMKPYLWGPDLLSQEETVKTLAKALGKDPKITSANKEEAYKMFVEERGVPPPLAEYMIRQSGKTVSGESQVFGYKVNKEELSNVGKYSGKKGTTFREWVEQKFVS